MKFKVGDVVKFINKSYPYYGKIFTIADIANNSIETIYGCKHDDENISCWCLESNLVLMKKASKEKEDKMKIFESNRDKILGDLFLNDSFKFMSGKFKGCYGIVCSCTANAINCIAFKEDPEEKVFCMVFSDAIPYPMFSIEDASTKIKKIPGKTIFEEE